MFRSIPLISVIHSWVDRGDTKEKRWDENEERWRTEGGEEGDAGTEWVEVRIARTKVVKKDRKESLTEFNFNRIERIWVKVKIVK